MWDLCVVKYPRLILKRPNHAQVTDSPTIIPATDIERAPFFVDRATAWLALVLLLMSHTKRPGENHTIQRVRSKAHRLQFWLWTLRWLITQLQSFWSKLSDKPFKLSPNVVDSEMTLCLAPSQLTYVSWDNANRPQKLSKDFTLQNLSVKFWRSVCYLKYTDTNIKLQGSQISDKHNTTKETNKSLITDLPKMEICGWPNK